jgi:hypothetical protein
MKNFLQTILLSSFSLLITLNLHGQCTISNLQIESGDCIEANFYSFTFDFNVSDNPNELFDLYLNGIYYDTYEIADLPVTVSPFEGSPGGVDTLLVCINDTESCCADGLIVNPCPCDYYNLESNVVSCTEDSMWFNLDFDYINVSDSFFMGTPGYFIGTFSVDDLPLEVGPFPRDLVPAEILISDQTDIFCFEAFNINDESCDQCHINNVTAVPSECNDDGMFFVTLSFEHMNTSGEGFRVVGNGNFYGEFAYEDSIQTGNGTYMDSLILGPLPGDCETIWEFVVIDNAIEGCNNFTGIDPVCCDTNCAITELAIYELFCTSQNTVEFILNFNYSNPGNDFFHLYSGDQHIGMYNLAHLPIYIEEFPVNEGETLLTVCINDQEDCCAELVIEPLNCGEGFCDIIEMVVDGVECTSDETISFYLDFGYQNTENDFFEIYSNDHLIGYYPLDELPIIVEDFPLGDDITVLTVCINDMEDCCEEYVFDNIDCSGFDCEIGEIHYEIEPVGQDSFMVFLTFANNGADADLFSIHGNGLYYGEFMYGELPVQLGPYACQDSIPLEYVIRDLNNPDCQKVLELGVIDCMTNTFDLPFDKLLVYGENKQIIIKDPSLELGREFSLRMVSNLGEIVLNSVKPATGYLTKINPGNLPAGLYYVEILNSEKRETFKIFLNK